MFLCAPTVQDLGGMKRLTTQEHIKQNLKEPDARHFQSFELGDLGTYIPRRLCGSI